MKKTHLIWVIFAWCIFLIASFCWNYHIIGANKEKSILRKAQSFFEQIKITRAWNAEHGGIYVPISEKTQPNPYLQDSLRDIETVNGFKLTKLNPAFMTRQIAEMNKNKKGVQFHITSLTPIRPLNKADKWEEKALKLFEKGETEFYELVEENEGLFYRYMAPLITEKSCLKCHSHQGYQLGNIRGGISVTFPMDAHLQSTKLEMISLGAVHIAIFFLGLFGLLYFNRETRKHLNMIRLKNKELVQSNATKDRFFSIIAHDLKSPFNSIIGFSNMLSTEYDDLSDEERKTYISKINQAADSSLHLLENLLLWSVSQQNSLKVLKLELKLFDVVNEAIEPYLAAAQLKEIHIRIDISTNFIVYVDSFCIKTVIANLFNNAIKYTSKKGVITISATRDEDGSIIVVNDNGVGIPEEVIPQLFKTESDISTPGTQNEKGTGLGLALCYDLIAKNDGSIEIESEIGIGSSVIVRLPNK